MNAADWNVSIDPRRRTRKRRRSCTKAIIRRPNMGGQEKTLYGTNHRNGFIGYTHSQITPPLCVVNWCRKSSGHVDKFHLRSSKLDTRNADGWLSEINLQLRQKKNLEQNYRQPWAIRSYSVTTMGVIIANCPSRNRLRDDNDSNSRLQNKYERPDVNYNVITVPERVIFGAQPIGSD